MPKRQRKSRRQPTSPTDHLINTRGINGTREWSFIASWLNQNGWRLLVVFIVVAIGRLPNLGAAGLNYDEPTYLYWGQVIGEDWEQRYIGAGWGGKQPLHTWAVALAEKLIRDPVIAGRSVSVVSGAVSATLIWAITKRLASERAAWLAAALYLVCPYTAGFDRAAMIDSFLTALAIGVLGASLLAVSGFYVSGALALAICFGGATLTKSIGWGFALLVPFSVLANPVPISELGKYRHRRHLHHMVVSSAIGLLLGAFIYYIVFGSSPAAELIRQFEAQYGKYTLSLGELLRFPFERWFANASMVFGWLVRLLTPPILILAVAGLTNLPKLGQKAWVLGAWVLFPTVGQILIANRFYSRYILFSIPPLLIIAAILLDRSYDFITTQMAKQQQAKQIKYLQIIAIVLFTGLLVWPVQATARKVLDGELAKETGYYSIYEAAEFIENQAERAPQTVIVAYSPSPVEDGMAVLLSKAPDVRVLRVALIEGQLTIFDPAQKLSIASVSLDAATTYFAALAGAEESSWLAGKIDPTHAFESPNGNNVVLYRIRFDASFR